MFAACATTGAADVPPRRAPRSSSTACFRFVPDTVASEGFPKWPPSVTGASLAPSRRAGEREAMAAAMAASGAVRLQRLVCSVCVWVPSEGQVP